MQTELRCASGKAPSAFGRCNEGDIIVRDVLWLSALQYTYN